MKINERLLRKAVAGELTEGEYNILDERASGWNVCAVGENRAALRKQGFSFSGVRSGSPNPANPFLAELGGKFSWLVASRHFRRALRLYLKIKRIAIGEIHVPGGAY